MKNWPPLVPLAIFFGRYLIAGSSCSDRPHPGTRPRERAVMDLRQGAGFLCETNTAIPSTVVRFTVAQERSRAYLQKEDVAESIDKTMRILRDFVFCLAAYNALKFLKMIVLFTHAHRTRYCTLPVFVKRCSVSALCLQSKKSI